MSRQPPHFSFSSLEALGNRNQPRTVVYSIQGRFQAFRIVVLFSARRQILYLIGTVALLPLRPTKANGLAESGDLFILLLLSPLNVFVSYSMLA